MTIRALPGASRPEDSLKFVAQACDEGARGVVTVVITKTGDVDIRIFGDARRFELAWAGAVLSEESVNGEFLPKEIEG